MCLVYGQTQNIELYYYKIIYTLLQYVLDAYLLGNLSLRLRLGALIPLL